MKTLPEPEIITRKGKPVSVILPIADYQELLERVEDADDLAQLKELRGKPLKYRPLEEYLAEKKPRAGYKVFLERAAEKDLKRLSHDIHDRVIAAI